MGLNRVWRKANGFTFYEIKFKVIIFIDLDFNLKILDLIFRFMM